LRGAPNHRFVGWSAWRCAGWRLQLNGEVVIAQFLIFEPRTCETVEEVKKEFAIQRGIEDRAKSCASCRVRAQHQTLSAGTPLRLNDHRDRGACVARLWAGCVSRTATTRRRSCTYWESSTETLRRGEGRRVLRLLRQHCARRATLGLYRGNFRDNLAEIRLLLLAQSSHNSQLLPSSV
jgi:hypothetical protein